VLLNDSSLSLFTFEPSPMSLTRRVACCVQFSPDGKKLILKDPKANFMIRDLESGKSLTLDQSSGTSFAISPDSKLMVAQCGTKATAPLHANYQIFELATGRRRGALEIDRNGPSFTQMLFSPDSKRIASASVYTIKLWNAANGKLIAKFEKPKHSMSDDSVHAVAFTADGTELIATTVRAFVFWDIASRQISATLRYEPPNGFLAVSPDGSTIATTAKNGDVLLWDVPGNRSAVRSTRNP
jgi:WD40 repeat protein